MLEQFKLLPHGPKLIACDINGDTANFPTVAEMLEELGWADAGNVPKACHQGLQQPTCLAQADAKESRVDFIFLNHCLAEAHQESYVDNDAVFPTHRPFGVKVKVGKIHRSGNNLIKPTDFSMLLEELIQEEIRKAKEVDEDTKVDEGKIRKRVIQHFHVELDKELGKREWRLIDANLRQDTDAQWILITAAVEQAAISFLKLIDKEATKMRGRSKITFAKIDKHLLEGAEKEATEEELSHIKLHANAADMHTAQGNRLLNVCRRMLSGAKNNSDPRKKSANYELCANTMDTYRKTVLNCQAKIDRRQQQQTDSDGLAPPC